MPRPPKENVKSRRRSNANAARSLDFEAEMIINSFMDDDYTVNHIREKFRQLAQSDALWESIATARAAANEAAAHRAALGKVLLQIKGNRK